MVRAGDQEPSVKANLSIIPVLREHGGLFLSSQPAETRGSDRSQEVNKLLCQNVENLSSTTLT